MLNIPRYPTVRSLTKDVALISPSSNSKPSQKRPSSQKPQPTNKALETINLLRGLRAEEAAAQLCRDHRQEQDLPPAHVRRRPAPGPLLLRQAGADGAGGRRLVHFTVRRAPAAFHVHHVHSHSDSAQGVLFVSWKQ